MKTERAHIKNLVLLNWRGIPFQVIEMDRRLTALEGENGAGKTTCMTAAYILLMPDINKMRVINVGADEEESRKNTSLHGKLGSSGACYSVFEIINPRGERCLVGAMMVPKAAQQVEVKHLFIVEKLPENVPLEDVLLVRNGQKDSIPTDASIIKEQAIISGGEARLFATIHEYGKALFESGILPMNLGNPKKLKQFNKILQTGLLGNFSTALQRRIKDYLLPDSTDIGSHLNQLQEHMRLCRSSHIAVERLEAKIDTVHDLHQKARTLIESAVATVRLFSDEKRQEVSDARENLEAARLDHKKLQQFLAEKKQNLTDAEANLASKKDEADKAEELRKKASEARDVTVEIESLEVHRETAIKQVEEAQVALDSKSNDLKTLKARYRSLGQEYKDICSRLANADEHWKKVTREAGLYEGANQALADAQGAIPEKDVSTDNAQLLLNDSEKKEKALGSEFSDLRRRTESAEGERERFNAAIALVAELAGHAVANEEGITEAQRLQSEHSSNAAIIKSAEALPVELETAKKLAVKQGSLRDELEIAKPLGVTITNSAHLIKAHNDFQVEMESTQENLDSAQVKKRELKGQLEEIKRDHKQAQNEVSVYENVNRMRESMETRYECSLKDLEAVSSLAEKLKSMYEQALSELKEAEQEGETLRAEIDRVQSRSDENDDGLLQAIDGKRVAAMFEDIDKKDAAELEARLGPIADALIVKDVENAVQILDSMEKQPQEVWLVERDKFKIDKLRGRSLEKSVAVSTDWGVRVTRLPKFPRLGYESRRDYVGHLQGLRREAEESAVSSRKLATELSEQIKRVHLLENDFSLFLRGDPRLKMTASELRMREIEKSINETKVQITSLTGINEKTRSIAEALRKLLPDGHLLDAEDYNEKVKSLQERIQSIEKLRRLQQEREHKINALDGYMQSLRYLPPSDEEMADMTRRLSQVEAELKFWGNARQSLEILVGNLKYFRFKDSYHHRQTMEDPTAELRKKAEDLATQVSSADENAQVAQEEFDESNSRLSKSQAELNAIVSSIDRLSQKLDALGVSGGAEFLSDAKRKEELAGRVYEEARGLYSDLEKTIRRCEGDLETKSNEIETSDKQFAKVKDEWEPASKVNDRVRKFSRDSKVLDRINGHIGDLQTEYKTPLEANNTTLTAWGDLRSKVESIERDLEHPLRDLLSKRPPSFLSTSSREQYLGEAWDEYLSVWELAFEYILQIVPADIVITNDPGEAVAEMRIKLKALKDAMKDAESRFKASSENVARTIRTKIRAANRNIGRYNTRLESISFGSLDGIKILFKPREEMMRLLAAMEDGDQWNLFTQDTVGDVGRNGEPMLAEVMNLFYKNNIGGKAEGDMLLDYRNYITMAVQVRRKGTGKWETPQELSTGEAMGTGAAILMVVLQAWEDQAVTRDSSLQHNLRFLFMDEAVRLDPKSIKSLLEFCKEMDVQLLIAGPSFKADETGGGVTYTLAREFPDEEKELVIIRGRKGFGSAPLKEAS
jgi:chromosome partition protein MukB